MHIATCKTLGVVTKTFILHLLSIAITHFLIKVAVGFAHLSVTVSVDSVTSSRRRFYYNGLFHFIRIHPPQKLTIPLQKLLCIHILQDSLLDSPDLINNLIPPPENYWYKIYYFLKLRVVTLRRWQRTWGIADGALRAMRWARTTPTCSNWTCPIFYFCDNKQLLLSPLLRSLNPKLTWQFP